MAFKIVGDKGKDMLGDDYVAGGGFERWTNADGSYCRRCVILGCSLATLSPVLN